MTPETLIQIQNIIEKFGFPVFVALCGLLLFAAIQETADQQLLTTRHSSPVTPLNTIHKQD